MSLSAEEQYLLEQINRGRLDPLAEAKRYGVNLNEGLEPGQIGSDALQVLAHNDQLSVAAEGHSTWMLEADVFSHTGSGSSSAGQRIESAGYGFSGSWQWRENLAWSGSTGTIDLGEAIDHHHEGLFLSAGHRANTFAADVREVGLAQVEGQFSLNGTSYNSSMLTENFAASGPEVFITGVAYVDRDRDDFYSIGEGQGNVTIHAGGGQDVTAASGGYAVALDATDNARVQIDLDGEQIATLNMDLSAGNGKLDLVTDTRGDLSLMVSADTNLQSGVANANLLGVADLNLSGTADANILTGNKGHNTIRGYGGEDVIKGGGGKDRLVGGGGDDELRGGSGLDKLYGKSGADLLIGGSGRDKLFGGSGDDELSGGRKKDVLKGGSGDDDLRGGAGNDVLRGGAGDDILRGGSGADKFVFNKGDDHIRDFRNNVDTIAVDDARLRGSDPTIDDLMDMGRIIDGNAVFTFEGGHTLTIDGVTDLDILHNDLILV